MSLPCRSGCFILSSVRTRPTPSPVEHLGKRSPTTRRLSSRRPEQRDHVALGGRGGGTRRNAPLALVDARATLASCLDLDADVRFHRACATAYGAACSSLGLAWPQRPQQGSAARQGRFGPPIFRHMGGQSQADSLGTHASTIEALTGESIILVYHRARGSTRFNQAPPSESRYEAAVVKIGIFAADSGSLVSEDKIVLDPVTSEYHDAS